MANWHNGAIQKTKDSFEDANTVLVKANSPRRFGIANRLDNGEISIINRKDTNRFWPYDSVESMIADGWVVD